MALAMEGTRAYAHELAARDATLAEALAEVEELRTRTHALRDDARSLMERLRRLPAERAGAAATLERAKADVEQRREALRRAEEEADRARGHREERRLAVEQARRALERAEEELAAAGARAGALRTQEDEARAAAAGLDVQADGLARELAGSPRLRAGLPHPSGPGLDGILDWTARTDGALLLARSALAGEREAVVREANELAAAVLGEQPVPAGVRLIVERLDRALEAG
jgi:hypothetical protein